MHGMLAQYKLTESRQSIHSALPRHIAYIDYRVLGVHELPRDINTNKVYYSILDKGYAGPAISAFYAFSDHRLDTTINNSKLHVPYGIIGVADGHNRLQALHLLDIQGLLRSPYIPVQLIPAHNAELVSRINVTNPHDKPLSLAEVESCFADPNRVVSVASSCFMARLTDNSWIRIRDAQPDITISRGNLMHKTPLSALSLENNT
jgi:hypothetical protein